jgi:hypothetical protein
MKIDDFIKQELLSSFQKQYKKSELLSHLESDTTRIIDFIVEEFSPKSATIRFNDNFAFLSILYDSKILYLYVQFYQNRKTAVKIVSTG